MFPPKYVKFKSGLIALEPQSGAHLSIAGRFPFQIPESAGFVTIGGDGYCFGGSSLTLRLHADADTTFDGTNLYYIFATDYWSGSREHMLSMVLNDQGEAAVLAKKLQDCIVCEGSWKDVALVDYSRPVRMCVPTANDVISADKMARELRAFFSEGFPPSVFEPVVEVKDIFVLMVSHNLGVTYKEVHRCDSLTDPKLKELMKEYAAKPNDQRVFIEKRSIGSDGVESVVEPLYHSSLGTLGPVEKTSLADKVNRLRNKFC